MEIRGEDFIKKVQLKQEENEIEQRLNEIKEAQSIYEEPVAPQPTQSRLDREIEIQEEQEYSDIMLGKGGGSSNESNKKKYLILGLILVILFLLTIIIIRLLTNDSTEENSFSKKTDNTTQKVIESENIEEQYQKIINEKLKNIKEENEKEIIPDDRIDEKLNLQKIEEREKSLKPVVREAKPDVFEVKEIEKPKTVVVSKPKPKPVPKPKSIVTPKKVTKPVSAVTTKPKGTFVQVGAFSKMPSDKYLTSINQKGFDYKVYKVSINNKIFHKVLIGPYNSRGQAKLAIDDIKKKLNISGAFILTF